MAVTGIGTYSSYTNSYGNTQNAGNKTGRTYKNAHEYKNYLTQKYDCLRSRDYSVNINSSLLSKAMGDEKTKQWLEYNLSLIPKTIEQSRAYVAARGAKILSYNVIRECWQLLWDLYKVGDNMVTYIFINHLDHIRKVIANSEWQRNINEKMQWRKCNGYNRRRKFL